MLWFLLALSTYLYLAGCALAWWSLTEEKIKYEDAWELGLAAGLIFFWPLAALLAGVLRAYFWARGDEDEFD